jgi:chromosome segregation ATPase
MKKFMIEFEHWKRETIAKWFVYLFPKQADQLIALVKDNMELQGIAVEQIKHIQELEDKVASLEYREEDLELSIERLEDEVRDLENDVDNKNWEIDSLEDDKRGLEYEVESLEDRINELETQLNDDNGGW